MHGHITMNYARDMAMTMAIWLKFIHYSAFVKFFLTKYSHPFVSIVPIVFWHGN
jgi:hypothetical protein